MTVVRVYLHGSLHFASDHSLLPLNPAEACAAFLLAPPDFCSALVYRGQIQDDGRHTGSNKQPLTPTGAVQTLLSKVQAACQFGFSHVQVLHLPYALTAPSSWQIGHITCNSAAVVQKGCQSLPPGDAAPRAWPALAQDLDKIHALRSSYLQTARQSVLRRWLLVAASCTLAAPSPACATRFFEPATASHMRAQLERLQYISRDAQSCQHQQLLIAYHGIAAGAVSLTCSLWLVPVLLRIGARIDAARLSAWFSEAHGIVTWCDPHLARYHRAAGQIVHCK
jgi:hypothetical protein